MTIKIKMEEGNVLLIYSPENGTEYILNGLGSDDDFVPIKRTFEVKRKHILKIDEDIAKFKIGELKNKYYEIDNTIIGTNQNVLFHENYDISIKDFLVESRISVLPKFETLAKQQIIIGGDGEDIIPGSIYRDIVNSFPTNTEIKLYKEARVTNILSEYLVGVKDSNSAFEDYLNKRKKIDFVDKLNGFGDLNKYEYEKYSFVLMKLEEMLKHYKIYSEKQWEQEIVKIILLLFPKYIHSFNSCPLKDFYSVLSTKPGDREIDFLLVDSNGYSDIIEIKKPSEDNLITKKPSNRDNHIPKNELSGAVMQVEKYLFHLSKRGIEGERNLTKRYKTEIKIASPKGLLILGRSNKLTYRQKIDFEIIKRKYANILDIITYDDLIERLENLLKKFKK